MGFQTMPASGAKLRASVLSTAVTEVREIIGIASGTTVNNSTTLVNATGMGCAVAINTTYRFRARFQYNSNATADFKVGWTFPTGTTMAYTAIGFLTSGAIALPSGIQTDAFGFGGGALSGTTDDSVVFEGTIVTSSTAGTVQAQVAQFTANVSNTILRANSYLVLVKVA